MTLMLLVAVLIWVLLLVLLLRKITLLASKKVQPHFGLQVFWQGHFPNVSTSNVICDGCTAVMRAHYNDDETE